MREASVNDSWRRLDQSNKYEYRIEKINLSGTINGTFEAYKGISAICGLNGAGKSTVMIAIKDALGINLKNQERKKIREQNITIEIHKGQEKEQINIENINGKRLTDIIKESSLAYYLDFELAVKANEYLDQDNLNELLEQYEEVIFNEKELKEISYLVGKEYSKCTVIEIEDDTDIQNPYFQSKENIEEYEENEGEVRIPYFKVVSQGIEYDSLTMGLGENILFYYYWFFKRISSSCIILLDEPETFLTIKSQENVMNFIAEKSYKLGINVIVSTHSPYLIKRLKNNNIYVLSKYFECSDISNSENKKDALMKLGMEATKVGIFYVEDEAGKYLLSMILSNNRNILRKLFDIEVTNGEGNITNLLEFPRSNQFSYILIGVYDGDMRNEINSSKINWDYIFLPGERPVEIELKEVLERNLSEFIIQTEKKRSEVLQILQNHSGENYHDWFVNVADDLGYNIENFIRILYKFWVNEPSNKELVEEFLNDLDNIINNDKKLKKIL